MSRFRLISWCRTHPEMVATTAVLLVTAWLAGIGSHGWHPNLTDGALAAVAWLPLLWRQRQPLPVLVAVVALDSIRAIAAGSSHQAVTTLPLATVLALYTVADRYRGRLVWSCAAGAGLVQFTVTLLAFDQLGRSFLYFNWALVGTAFGMMIAERQRRIEAAEERLAEAERSKDLEARRQVTAERVRIARELHDSLAHHITVVNAQAGVAQYLLRENPDAAEQALSGIVENTQAALDELRSTLGLLREERYRPDGQDPDRIPTPGLSQLDALLRNMRDTGMTLTANTYGQACALPDLTDLTAYRVIQEALSNAAKHAPGAEVMVTLNWGKETLSLNVENSAPPTAGSKPAFAPVEGTGHGLLGMRERVAAAGGHLNIGPTADDGFKVAVQLPLTVSR